MTINRKGQKIIILYPASPFILVPIHYCTLSSSNYSCFSLLLWPRYNWAVSCRDGLSLTNKIRNSIGWIKIMCISEWSMRNKNSTCVTLALNLMFNLLNYSITEITLSPVQVQTKLIFLTLFFFSSKQWIPVEIVHYFVVRIGQIGHLKI